MIDTTFNIAAVERDTGLSKDVLRMWERRYGFPVPQRDSNGERCYVTEQVERLRLIKRLMDSGHRPGKLLAMSAEALAELAPRRSTTPAEGSATTGADDLNALFILIKTHDSAGYHQAMQHRLAREGMLRFVQYTVAPLTQRIGVAWEEGRIEVFEEHLFTELTKRLLRQAIAALPYVRGGPRVLLTSVPEEQHVLGLLMVEALFSLEGAECIPLGTEMPLTEIGRAAQAHQADIVTLSFSSAFSRRQIPTLLLQLRQLLPPTVALWTGGAGVAHTTPPAGVEQFASLEQGVQALREWRKAA